MQTHTMPYWIHPLARMGRAQKQDSQANQMSALRKVRDMDKEEIKPAPPAGSMRAEVRIQRSITDEYDSFLVLICHGESYPYMHIPDDMPDDVLKHALEKLNA